MTVGIQKYKSIQPLLGTIKPHLIFFFNFRLSTARVVFVKKKTYSKKTISPWLRWYGNFRILRTGYTLTRAFIDKLSWLTVMYRILTSETLLILVRWSRLIMKSLEITVCKYFEVTGAPRERTVSIPDSRNCLLWNWSPSENVLIFLLTPSPVETGNRATSGNINAKAPLVS